MTKEQIEQAAKAAGKKYRETHLLQYNSRYQEHGENDFAKGFEQGATSPEAAAYHEGEKDEAIRELVEGLEEIFEQYGYECETHATSCGVKIEDWVNDLPTYQKVKQLLTKYKQP